MVVTENVVLVDVVVVVAVVVVTVVEVAAHVSTVSSTSYMGTFSMNCRQQRTWPYLHDLPKEKSISWVSHSDSWTQPHRSTGTNLEVSGSVTRWNVAGGRVLVVVDAVVVVVVAVVVAAVVVVATGSVSINVASERKPDVEVDANDDTVGPDTNDVVAGAD